jgi:hypothetical protein
MEYVGLVKTCWILGSHISNNKKYNFQDMAQCSLVEVH